MTIVPSDSERSATTKVVVATTVALSFISFWRAAAVVLSDLASSAFYAGGIAELQRLDIVLASDGDRKRHERFIRSAGLGSFPYVVSTELGLTYRVARLPFGVLIDPAGVVRSKGLVNNREQLESLFNANEMKAASIQAYLGGGPRQLRAGDGR